MLFRLSRWFERRKHDFGRIKILNFQLEGLSSIVGGFRPPFLGVCRDVQRGVQGCVEGCAEGCAQRDVERGVQRGVNGCAEGCAQRDVQRGVQRGVHKGMCRGVCRDVQRGVQGCAEGCAQCVTYTSRYVHPVTYAIVAL